PRLVARSRPRRRHLSQRVALMIDIRSATSADAASLAELRWEFRTSRVPPAETRDGVGMRCAPWLRRELTNATSRRDWVAVRPTEIVGQVCLHPVHKIQNQVHDLD